MDGTPNIFSSFALILWVPIALVTFQRIRDPVRATAWLMLGAIMFLPEWISFDPPLLPPFDKNSLASIWVLLGCWLKAREKILAAKPLRGIDLLFVFACCGLIGTSLTNTDPLFFGPTYIQELAVYDAFAQAVKDSLSIYVPFFVGRAMFRGSNDLRTFLHVFVTAGIVYGALCLFEMRFSPQLHRWAYGFHQMDFGMAIRMGGYRPMVFMLTGLAVAMFMLSTALAAVVLHRAGEIKTRVPIGLTIVFFLCKSTGSWVYAFITIPLIAFRKKTGVRLAVALACLVITFPILRAADYFPTDDLVEMAERYTDEERALSLWGRFYNEDELLERARERIWFGWGGYGRSRIWDPVTGDDLSVTDGAWIIDLGARGAVGFASLYLMLVIPIFMAWRGLAKIPDVRDRRMVAALALIVALNATDLLPNGQFSYYPFFYAGILAGVMQGGRWKRPGARAIKAEERAVERRERRMRRSDRPPAITPS